MLAALIIIHLEHVNWYIQLRLSCDEPNPNPSPKLKWLVYPVSCRSGEKTVSPSPQCGQCGPRYGHGTASMKSSSTHFTPLTELKICSTTAVAVTD